MRYRFDTALARGGWVVIGWLGLLTLAVVAIGAMLITVFGLAGVGGESSTGFGEALWQTLLRILDSGTFAGDTGWAARLDGLVVTICGIFIAGAFIGLVATNLDQRIEELSRGRSRVIERDHTLVLGWSDRVPTIVAQLKVANESRQRAVVVVLADRDAKDLDAELRRAVPDLGTTRVVFRSGAPWMKSNLDLVNPADARSVVVVGDDQASDADSHTVKVLLALQASYGDGLEGHIVAELHDGVTAQSVEALFGERLAVVRADGLIADLTAQACRQSGLSEVFRELLDFEGHETYISPFPELTGSTYAEAQLRFDSSSVIGLLRDGVVTLNPAPDVGLRDGDSVIAVAEDDSTFHSCLPVAAMGPTQARVTGGRSAAARRIVVCGWSDVGARVLAGIAAFMPDTHVTLIIDPELVDPDAASRAAMAAAALSIETDPCGHGPDDHLGHHHATRHRRRDRARLPRRARPRDR